MPVGWETHSSPELGATAQELINDRVLEDCDLLVGIFWTRLGTPTGNSSSGTVEEIHRHVEAGKPAMVYFGEAPVAPSMLDSTQYAALQQFRNWCESQGLVETFLNSADFLAKFRRHLQIALQKNAYLRQVFLQIQSIQSDKRKATGESEHNNVPVANAISPEAEKLLVAASEDRNGTIFSVDLMSGRIIQTGSLEIGEASNARELAKWEYGLEQLEALSLVKKAASHAKGERVFELTNEGYTLADLIRSAK